MAKPNMELITGEDIERAAAENDVDAAFEPLMDKVGVEDGGPAEIMLMSYACDIGIGSDGNSSDLWKQMNREQRLDFIAVWIRSEPNYHDDTPQP
jgi:hypothetical protein